MAALRVPVNASSRRLGISAETVELIVENQLKDDKQIDPARVIKHVGMDEISLKKRQKLYVTVIVSGLKAVFLGFCTKNRKSPDLARVLYPEPEGPSSLLRFLRSLFKSGPPPAVARLLTNVPLETNITTMIPPSSGTSAWYSSLNRPGSPFVSYVSTENSGEEGSAQNPQTVRTTTHNSAARRNPLLSSCSVASCCDPFPMRKLQIPTL
jgi:hypothetical protein